MGRLRSLIALLLVVLVTAWSEGLCRPAMATPAHAEAPCHGDRKDAQQENRHGDAHGTPTSAARACSVCPLCAPVAPYLGVDPDRAADPPRVLRLDAERPADRPGPRPPVPPPKAGV